MQRQEQTRKGVISEKEIPQKNAHFIYRRRWYSENKTYHTSCVIVNVQYFKALMNQNLNIHPDMGFCYAPINVKKLKWYDF